MSIEFSCFISYRHSSVASGAAYVREFIDGFVEELGRWTEYPHSLDEQRLTVGDFVDETLAAKLRKSATLVVLYTPPYFSTQKPFCSREYFGMLDLESERLKHFAEPAQGGLIIPLALRDHDGMVNRVRNADKQWSKARGHEPRNRLGTNFEQFSKKKQLQPGGTLNGQLQVVCQAIGNRTLAFQQLPDEKGDEIFGVDDAWQLPAEATVKPWVQEILGFSKPVLPSKIA
jgi:hypothetical protein